MGAYLAASNSTCLVACFSSLPIKSVTASKEPRVNGLIFGNLSTSGCMMATVSEPEILGSDQLSMGGSAFPTAQRFSKWPSLWKPDPADGPTVREGDGVD